MYLLTYVFFWCNSFPCQNILMNVKSILFVNYALGVKMFIFKFKSSVHFSMKKSLENTILQSSKSKKRHLQISKLSTANYKHTNFVSGPLRILDNFGLKTCYSSSNNILWNNYLKKRLGTPLKHPPNPHEWQWLWWPPQRIDTRTSAFVCEFCIAFMGHWPLAKTRINWMQLPWTWNTS